MVTTLVNATAAFLGISNGREMDLGIRQVDDCVMECAFGAFEMDAREVAPTMECAFGAFDMNAREVAPTMECAFGAFEMNAREVAPTMECAFGAFEMNAREIKVVG